MNVPLSRIREIDSGTRRALERANIQTSKEVLTKSPLSLVASLQLSLMRVQTLTSLVSRSCCPAPSSVSPSLQSRLFVSCFSPRWPLIDEQKALEMMRKGGEEQKVSTSLRGLYEALKGGLLHSSITEIAGPSLSGKTQFCMWLAAQCVLSPLSSSSTSSSTSSLLLPKVLFVSPDGSPSVARLEQMGSTLLSDLPNTVNWQEQIIVRSPTSCQDLLSMYVKHNDQTIKR